MPTERDRPGPDPERRPDPEASEPTEVPPVRDEDTGEELGEVSGGGKVTDLGGDGPSS